MSFSFPLSFEAISLWLAFNTFILLVATEALIPYIGKTRIGINHRRLGKAALMVAILFLMLMAITIMRLILAT